MTVCGGWSLINHRRAVTRAITLWCRSWSCPDCMPRRLRQLKRLAVSGNPSKLITLTVNPKHGESVEHRAQELTDAWKIVVKRARRRFPKEPLEYLAVFEETKKGEPHLHIVARAPFIPQRWLSDQMAELIKAPIVDIRTIHSKAGVALYVAKYIAKGPRAFGQMKRYWSSGSYAPKPMERRATRDAFGSGWSVLQVPLWLLFEQFRQMGLDPDWDGDNAFIHEPGRRRPPAGFLRPDWQTP